VSGALNLRVSTGSRTLPSCPLKTPRRISGLIAAPFTPLSANGELNLRLIPAYAARLARDGVVGAFICGTTGEGASLTTDERMRVAAAWTKVRARVQVIVHVGHNCLSDCRALARHAQQVKVDAIAAMAPSFFRPAALADLVDWCEAIAAAAPKLPFYFYHMPSMTGVDFPMSEFLPLAARRIPTFAGIKYTHDNLMDFGNTLGVAGIRFAVLAGRDEILLSYLALGADGAVGSTYNYAAPIYRQMMAAHERGDQASAKKLQAVVRAFIAVMIKSGGIAANKATMRIVSGLDCGPVRQPNRNLTREEHTTLRRGLEASGLFAALAAVGADNRR
jgi:N-acetylneuraminate lyase